MAKEKNDGKSTDKGRKSFVGLAIMSTLCVVLGLMALRFGVFQPMVTEDSDKTAKAKTEANVEGKSEPDAEAKPEKTEKEASPAATDDSPASIDRVKNSDTELEADLAPIVPEDFTKVSVGSAKDGIGYTAVFNRRGAALAVLRFSEESGEKVTPIFVGTPRSPVVAPSLDSAEDTLLFLGPTSSLRPWKWDREAGRSVPKDPIQDAFTAFPERAGENFDRIWNIKRDGVSQPLAQYAAFELIGGDSVLNAVRWNLSEAPKLLEDGSATLSYRARAGDLEYTKRFHLYPHFKVACTISLKNVGTTDLSRSLSVFGPAGVRLDVVDSYTRHVTSLFGNSGGNSYGSEELTFPALRGELSDYIEDGERDQNLASIPASALFDRDRDWHENVLLNGISNGYFLAAIGVDYLPGIYYGDDWKGLIGGDFTLGGKIAGEKDDEPNIYASLSFPEFDIPVGETVSRRTVLFAGPRDKAEITRAFEAGLDNEGKQDGMSVGSNASWSEYLSTGWPEIISAPITWLLRLLRESLGGMGLAVLALTIIVRLCMSPLSIRSQKSMQIHSHKMRGVKPKLDAVRAKYKDNKSRETQMLQFQETRAIMKANNVSLLPLGGCLPVLLQFPIFLALYNSVRTSFLLRHEHFLWMEDLSRPDSLIGAWEHGIGFLSFLSNGGFMTLNILPILWSVMLVVQQMGQTPPSDPQQAKMQKQMRFIMPLMGVMFYAMPAGFTLYFVMSSLYTFVEVKLVRMYLVAKGIIDPPEKPGDKDKPKITIEKKA